VRFGSICYRCDSVRIVIDAIRFDLLSVRFVIGAIRFDLLSGDSVQFVIGAIRFDLSSVRFGSFCYRCDSVRFVIGSIFHLFTGKGTNITTLMLILQVLHHASPVPPRMMPP
jgi:hypothetical protein